MVKGTELVGLKYEPIFNYFADRGSAFVVCADTYVTNDSGTGIVHQVQRTFGWLISRGNGLNLWILECFSLNLTGMNPPTDVCEGQNPVQCSDAVVGTSVEVVLARNYRNKPRFKFLRSNLS